MKWLWLDNSILAGIKRRDKNIKDNAMYLMPIGQILKIHNLKKRIHDVMLHLPSQGFNICWMMNITVKSVFVRKKRLLPNTLDAKMSKKLDAKMSKNKAQYERFKYHSNQRRKELELIKLEAFFKSRKKARRGYEDLNR